VTKCPTWYASLPHSFMGIELITVQRVHRNSNLPRMHYTLHLIVALFPYPTLQKWDGYFNLAKVFSVKLQLNDILSPPHWVYISPYTLETEGMWAMCSVSPRSCGGLSGRVNDSSIVYQAWQRSGHRSWAVCPSSINSCHSTQLLYNTQLLILETPYTLHAHMPSASRE